MGDYYDDQRKQAEEKRRSLKFASEMLVMGECLRRDWPASIIINSSVGSAVRLNDSPLEIRLESDSKFSRDNLPSRPVIFVFLPRSVSDPPEYFILSKDEIEEATNGRYRPPYHFGKKTGRNEKLLPPADILLDEVRPYQGRWDTLADAYKLARVDWNTSREGKPDPREQ